VTAGVEESVARALAFLRRRQDPSGEFGVRTWREGEEPSAGVADHSVFVTACVLYALRHVQTVQVDDIARAAIRFLIKEMRPPGVWSYWTADSGKRIDPDLDDTALISFLLRRHHPHIALGTNVGAILSARDEAGLFFTWLRGPDRQNDVDAVVNANVVLFLGERPETEAACAYLRDCVLTGQEAGSYRYYVDDAALRYAISRASWHGVRGMDDLRETLAEKALSRQRPDGSFGDALCTAWTVSTLLNVGADCPDAIGRALGSLLAGQLPDGGWPAVAAFAGPEPPAPRTLRWGSGELTTAACVEALARAAETVATRSPLV
jgi:hypothetical protein